MDDLKKTIIEGLKNKMNLEDSDVENFGYDAPLFISDEKEGEPCLGFDSVDALEMVVMIYEKWGIDVATDDMPKLHTVNDIADYIRSHTA